VKELIAAGANVDKAMTDGSTPLIIASSTGHLASSAGVVKELIDAGGDVDKAMPDGRTPLLIASFLGHVQIVQALIAAGGEVDKAMTDGRTPLYLASSAGHLEVVSWLIAAGGAAVTLQPPPPTLPLYIAAQHGLLDFYSLLPPELAANGADCDAVLSLLRKGKCDKERRARRHQLLVCVANARGAQGAGRGEGLHELLGRIARLPPEVVREHVIPHCS
jgi:hypothetical protein